MSELLISWLNDEVQLSKRITNFEEDFHNGYLFGQLLSKYSQQLNFNEFVNKDDKTSRINNFTLLYDTFKTLRVSFDSNIAMNIIEKKLGIAKKVLYELKMQLQKTTTNSFNKMTKPIKPLSPLKKIQVPKDKYDKISKEHFTKQLNQIHQAQKNLDLDSHLRKFPEFHQKQLEKIDSEEKKQTQARLLGQKKFRQKQLDNIKKSSDFRNDWQQQNAEKWAANLTIRKLQVEKDTLFKTKFQNSKIQNKTMSELSAIKNLDKDLKQFQKKTLKRQNGSSSSSSSSSGSKKIRQSKKQSGVLLKKSSSKIKVAEEATSMSRSFGGTQAFLEQGRKKKNPQETQQIRHQRQKRRRKMIVEQSKKHHLIKVDRMEKYIISTLQQNSKQEKQLEYEIWRAWQNKEVIAQNKNAQVEKIKEKEQTRALNKKFKDEELTKTFRDEHRKELNQGLARQNKLKNDNAVRNRKAAYEQCRGIIEKFIQMTELTYEYCQQKNINEFDAPFFNHLMDEFVEAASQQREIAEVQFKNYVHGRGEWDIEIKREGAEQPSLPTDDNSIPERIINNYYLGNILKTVFSEIYQPSAGFNAQQAQYQNVFLLLGLEFSGKRTLAQQIKEHYGFELIEIEKLVAEKVQDYYNLVNKGLEIDGETARLVEIVQSGKSVPNELVLGLLRDRVEKNPKALIVNYPTTYEQCIELTKVLGGVQPADYSQKSGLDQKIEEFSRLVWPTEKVLVPRALKPCGIDYALWLDISPKASLNRFLGRRWTEEGRCVHIDEEIDDPNQLIVGEKGSAVILKNNFKLKNKTKIEQWLSQFGTSVQENDQTVVQKCWENVPGQISTEALKESVFRLIDRNLEIKQLRQKQIAAIKQKQQENIKQREKIEAIEKDLKLKCVLSTPEEIRSRLQSAVGSVTIEKNFLENFQRLWNNTERLTITGLTNIFQMLRQQEQYKNKYLGETRKRFLLLLTREDERFYLVKKFQNEYNKFIDENNDMIIQEHTKEQLHQRIEDLETELLTLIEEKKQDASNQKDSIIKSGWLQSQLDQIMQCVHIILQIELNRTFACQQIIADFYSKKYNCSVGQVQEISTELSMENDLETIKDGTFPRLDKLLAEALRIFNRQEEVVEDKNKKGGKAPPKKDDKKQPKKGKEQVEQKAEPTPEEIEYKKALNTEKAIFRYRLKAIGLFAAGKLRKFQQEGLKMYKDLEDYYKYTDRIENYSITEMIKIFKRAIESERKIESEVTIHYTEILESDLVRNFVKPKPVILPAFEQVKSNRFSIGSIQQIMRLFRAESEAQKVIKNHRLMFLLEQFSNNQRFRAILPEDWRGLTREQHENFVRRFDPRHEGEVDLSVIFVVIALTNFRLPSVAELEEYTLMLTDHNPLTKQVSLAQIQKARSWFDQDEPRQQNCRYFDRTQQLKKTLFHIFAAQGDLKVPLDHFIRTTALLEYSGAADMPASRTYFDFAFAYD